MNLNNTLTLIGRLDRNPVYVTTENGADLTRFELLTKRQTDSPAGVVRPLYDRHVCVAWGPAALNLHEYLRVGSRVAVKGQLVYSQPDRPGDRIAEIHVEGFTFLGEPNFKQLRSRKYAARSLVAMASE